MLHHKPLINFTVCENKTPTGLTLCVHKVCEAHRSAGPSTAVCGLSSACRWWLGSCVWGHRPLWCRTWSEPRPPSWTDSGAGHDLENSDTDTSIFFTYTYFHYTWRRYELQTVQNHVNHSYKIVNVTLTLKCTVMLQGNTVLDACRSNRTPIG